jgi:hypothetical protein
MRGIQSDIDLRRSTGTVELELRVTKLPDAKWKRDVKGLFFDYLSTGDKSTLLLEAEKSLNAYAYLWPLSSLELAIWKAACILHGSDTIMLSSAKLTTLEDSILFAGTHRSPSWKEYWTEMRKSNAIEIIMLSCHS